MSKKSVIRVQDAWKIYKLGEVEVPAIRGINIDIKEATTEKCRCYHFVK